MSLVSLLDLEDRVDIDPAQRLITPLHAAVRRVRRAGRRPPPRRSRLAQESVELLELERAGDPLAPEHLRGRAGGHVSREEGRPGQTAAPRLVASSRTGQRSAAAGEPSHHRLARRGCPASSAAYSQQPRGTARARRRARRRSPHDAAATERSRPSACRRQSSARGSEPAASRIGGVPSGAIKARGSASLSWSPTRLADRPV